MGDIRGEGDFWDELSELEDKQIDEFLGGLDDRELEATMFDFVNGSVQTRYKWDLLKLVSAGTYLAFVFSTVAIAPVVPLVSAVVSNPLFAVFAQLSSGQFPTEPSQAIGISGVILAAGVLWRQWKNVSGFRTAKHIADDIEERKLDELDSAWHKLDAYRARLGTSA